MIREAIIDDYKEIKNICENDLGYPCDYELVKNRLSNLNKDREIVYVAVYDNQVVGFIHIEKYELLYFEPRANIIGIAVSKSYQRQGIGSKLLTQAEVWAKSKGIKVMRLNSGIKRKEAHNFYQKAGYQDIKEQLIFIKKIEE